jgi:serine/threonine protein kinase
MDPFYFYYSIHSNKSDVYSAGVILFELFFQLSGEWSPDQPIINIYWEPSFLCGPYGLSKCVSWKDFVLRHEMKSHPDINDDVKLKSLKTLLYGMLQPNPMFRMTAAQALSHTWLNQHSGGGKHNLTSKRRRTGTRNKRRK